MQLTVKGYLEALDSLGYLWEGGDAENITFAAAVAASETGLIGLSGTEIQAR